jgi:hypothetical protein
VGSDEYNAARQALIDDGITQRQITDVNLGKDLWPTEESIGADEIDSCAG